LGRLPPLAEHHQLEDILAADGRARAMAQQIIHNLPALRGRHVAIH
jgi:hypothetical protein